MIARFLTILMTIALTLQGLAVPHCHGENVMGQGADHAQTPHFHFGHHHHHGKHAHSHRDCDCPHGDRDDDCSQVPTQQHDDDAVFVTGDLFVGHTQVRVPTSDLCVAIARDVVSASTVLDTLHRWVLEPPPDIGGFPSVLNSVSLRL
jgi:hypothetical protein